jgi:hypothetical protein
MDRDAIDVGIKQQIKVVQIITVALMLGVLTFGAIAFQLGNGKQIPQEPIVTYITLGLAMQAFLLHLLVPMIIAKKQIKGLAHLTDDIREELLGIHRVKTIIAFALLEGAAFLSLVSYIIEGHPFALGMAIGMLFFMSIEFPGTSRVLNWIESNVEAIRQVQNVTESH